MTDPSDTEMSTVHIHENPGSTPREPDSAQAHSDSSVHPTRRHIQLNRRRDNATAGDVPPHPTANQVQRSAVTLSSPSPPFTATAVPSSSPSSIVVATSPPTLGPAPSIPKRNTPPTFLASFNSNFAYVHQHQTDGSEGRFVDSKRKSGELLKLIGRPLPPLGNQSDAAVTTVSSAPTAVVSGGTSNGSSELPTHAHRKSAGLISEPPSVQTTPEWKRTRLASSSNLGIGNDADSEDINGEEDANENGTATLNHRLKSHRSSSQQGASLDGVVVETVNGVDKQHEADKHGTNSTSTPQKQDTHKHHEARTVTGQTTSTFPQKAQRVLGSDGTEEGQSDPQSKLKPVTCLKFHWLFLALTVVQVAVCCSIIWYLGDKNARQTVDSLTRQIRSEILMKVEAGIIGLLLNSLNACDQLFTIVASLPPLLQVVSTETSITQFNVSYIFPPAKVLAQFPTMPQVGYMAPRNILVAARRPDLINGYLSSSTTASPNCLGQNDGSGGCFFHSNVNFQYSLSDPDEPHVYLIQEDPDPSLFPNGTYPDMAQKYYNSMWDFNRLKYLKYKGLKATVPTNSPWDPFHNEADFLPSVTGPEINEMLRYYADQEYAEAVRLGTTPLPLNSSTAPLPSGPAVDLKSRPFYADAVTLNGRLGWSRTYLAFTNQIAVSAVKAYMNPADTQYGVGFVAFSVLYYNSFSSQLFNTLKSPINAAADGTIDNPNSEVFIFEQNGLLVATTYAPLDSRSQQVTRTNLYTSPLDLLAHIRNIVDGTGLLQVDAPNSTASWGIPINVTAASSVPSQYHDKIVVDESFTYGGDSYHLRASPIPAALGLNWFIVVITLDSDYDQSFRSNTVSTAWFSALVGVVSILFTLLLVQMLTRPLAKLVGFMEDVSWRLLQAKNDTTEQHNVLNELRAIWQSSIEKPMLFSGNVDEELADMRRKRRKAIKIEEEKERAAAAAAAAAAAHGHGSNPAGKESHSDTDLSGDSHSQSESDRSSRDGDSEVKPNSRNGCSRFCHSVYKLLCVRTPRRVISLLPNVPFQETQMLHRTFAAMLTGLQSSHEMLQTANESKRRFIRYIFHEVRVPFNAIVLGVEQLREDLYTEPLRPVEEMQDVVNILNEQSKVVARILNDVLSLQKIEDGALKLEMAPFNMIELVCGTLRSFQPLLAEKNLILMTEMEDVDQAILKTRTQKVLLTLGASLSGLKDVGSLSNLQIGTTPERKAIAAVPSSAPASAPAVAAVAATSSSAQSEDERKVHIHTHRHNPFPTPLSAVITPSQPGPDTDAAAAYQNAYEDSKELQRFAESCSREVLGDRYRLRQVLANFLSNAVKFTPSGGTIIVKVSCSFAEEDENATVDKDNDPAVVAAATALSGLSASPEGSPTPLLQGELTNGPIPTVTTKHARQVNQSLSLSALRWSPPKRVAMRVSVSDSGRGLSSSELSQMFRPYVQFQSGEQQQGKGTGLGLNISKSLIELHGGVIGVSSTGILGEGCTFFFDVPFEIVPLSVSHTSKVSSPQPNTVPGTGLAKPRSISRSATGMFDPSAVTLPGLRAWHSPRSVVRTLGATGTGANSSHPSPYNVPRRAHVAGDEHPSSECTPSSGPLKGGRSSPGTPLRIPNNETEIGLGAIEPSGTDDKSNLQYMSQLNFLSDLALQNQTVKSNSNGTSPLSQYRSVMLSQQQGVPHGIGYGSSRASGAMNTPAAIEAGTYQPVHPYSQSRATPLPPTSEMPFPSSMDGANGPMLNETTLLDVRSPKSDGVSPENASMMNGASAVPVRAKFGPSAVTKPDSPRATRFTSTSSSRVPYVSPTNAALTRNLAHANSNSASTVTTISSADSNSTASRNVAALATPTDSIGSNALLSPSTAASTITPPTANFWLPQTTPASTTSTAGQGLTITSPTNSAAVTSPTAANAPTTPSANGVARPRVLVVEDSIPNRKLLMMLLRALKCDPVGVENGLLAVQEFDSTITDMETLCTQIKAGTKSQFAIEDQKGPYDLVLMDGNMPVLDGVHATRHLRTLGFTAPIVAVTGNALAEDAAAFLSAGASELLSKPVQRAALEKVLVKWIPSFRITPSVAPRR